MSRFKVLVAEDFDSFRDFVCGELRRRDDLDVDVVADGLVAVERSRAWQPDMVLLDIGLPTVSGIAAGQQIRVQCPGTKIVFLTQESSPEIVQAALGVGAHAYIRKLRADDYLLDTVDLIVDGLRAVRREGDGQGQHRSPAAGHHAHLYPDDAALLDSLEHFVASALLAHDAAIVMATTPHLERLLQRLRRLGVDVDGTLARGTFRIFDAAAMLSQVVHEDHVDYDLFRTGLAELIESTARATMQERPRIAIFGECGALLCAQGQLDRAVGLEHTGNELIGVRNGPLVNIICAYPLLPAATEPDFKRICGAHSAVAVR